jgi:transcription-repair coupling factor (superfamily II helicase)
MVRRRSLAQRNQSIDGGHVVVGGVVPGLTSSSRRYSTIEEDVDEDSRMSAIEDDVISSSEEESAITDNSDEEDDSWIESPKKKQLSLSELEDYEEARLALLDRREEEEFSIRSSSVAPLTTVDDDDGGVLLSNIYSSAKQRSDDYSTRLDTARDRLGDDPLTLTVEKEILLAKKRDALQNNRFNEMFADEDAITANRQSRIRQLMDEDDKVWKAERRKRLLGKYATVESWEEVEKLLEDDRTKEVQEIEKKVELAKKVGVTLTMLEPNESSSSFGRSDDALSGDGSGGAVNRSRPIFNQKSAIGVSSGKASWFGLDDNIDLEAEFQSLPLKAAVSSTTVDINNDDDRVLQQSNDENNTAGSTSSSSSLKGDDGPRFINGRLTSREQLMGISVGSAGGWSLEVYPGDFVVHRKYGIGKYEKTILKPKTKLTLEERMAMEGRRKEIINSLMKEGKQLVEIQRVVETFGTNQDTDPISNPLSTFLEISYNDAAVHVPIDRAYRLSRYRAGDTVIKPKLSRVKGEAWMKAKQKVEVSTIQMAEDVLALYATRETLSRVPFDPSLESRVREFSKSFAFEPTPDQRKCFEDVENDMVWRSRPMDRLICGDVGFGKTEVAIRALFRSVVNGRQAALLAPTGVLAAQHYKNIVKRMGIDTEHGFRIALLRGGGGMGKNTKKGRELRSSISAGEVDIVVGTHALLSNGMSFKDLGLLTIDEEQVST